MANIQHINSLKNRHQAIESQIVQEQKRTHPDTILITTLKQQKLRLKDRIDLLAG